MWLIDKSAGPAINFVAVFVDGPIGLPTHEEAEKLANEITRAMNAAQQNAHLTGLTWRCEACYRVNDKSNKVCWFCETAPQVA